MQAQIIAALHAKPTIDPAAELRARVDFLTRFLITRPFLNSLVLGVSGGQDSTLTGRICQQAVDQLNAEADKKHRYSLICVRLPYGIQADESDCQDALEFIKPTHCVTINIKDSVDAMVASVEHGLRNSSAQSFHSKVNDFNKGNLKARARMIAQYAVAGEAKGAVVGTDHAAEAVTGFFTKHGDGGTDVNPISGLTKNQGRALLQFLGCPQHLYTKAPTADLEDEKPSLPDEVALGVTYDIIDAYLEGKPVPDEDRTRIESMYTRSQHKRQLPCVPGAVDA